MAEKLGVVDSLLNGLDTFATAKTVVGEPITVNDTVIVPLVDVSFGIGAGGALNGGKTKQNEAGGAGAKMSPSAVLVIRGGNTRLVSVKNQDKVTKIMDMVPEVINRITGKHKDADPAVEEKINEIKKGK